METANLSFGDESSFEDMLKELASKQLKQLELFNGNS